MLDVRNLTKLYGDRPAVQGLSFHAAAGEILGLVGENGAGKTTTLRCISGVFAPSSGEIEVAGHKMATSPIPAKQSLAFVPDEPQLFDYLTVEEHLKFTARLYGLGGVQPEIGRLLTEMELEPRRASLAQELSRGMKQKLTLACALLHRPSLLLLDEPLTGLDPAGIRRVKDILAAQARAGTCVVLSSHLLSLVEELSSRVLLLHQGRALAFGTIEEITAARPALAGQGLEAIFLALTSSGKTSPE
ncbi:MAG: ABC transporter ATP-binding protein [Gemmatimonadales bacterium]